MSSCTLLSRPTGGSAAETVSDGSGWISFKAPLRRPRVRLLRRPVEVFLDENDNYPTVRFVRSEGDFDVL